MVNLIKIGDSSYYYWRNDALSCRCHIVWDESLRVRTGYRLCTQVMLVDEN